MDGWCGSPHPEFGITCVADKGSNHEVHVGRQGMDTITWPRPEYVEGSPLGSPGKNRDRQIVQGMKREAKSISRVVRTTDPESAHIAAARIEPKRGTRKAAVLARLQQGGWVDGVEIASVEIGGSEGLRRLRELGDDGWVIEKRPHPQSDTAWQYRLAVDFLEPGTV